MGSIEYRYDFMGRLAAMETPAGTVRYEYWTGQNTVVRILPNAVRTCWRYDAEGRLVELSHVDPKNYVMAKFSYEYRPDGLIAGITEWWPPGERHLCFEYDTVQRLAGLSDGQGNGRAEYDPMGNHLRGGFQDEERGECRYDWAGRLLSVSGVPGAHDAAGNLVHATVNGVERHFEFDHENRLCKAGEVTYEYDGDGCLIARTVGGRRTTYLSDPTTDILAAAARDRRRWPTPSLPLGGSHPAGRGGGRQAVIFPGRPFGFGPRRGGCGGAVVERRDYSAFGVGSTTLPGADLTPGFAGLFQDAVAGVYLTRARAYCAELGRFLQIDPQHRVPSGRQNDLSLFAYCSADPVNNLDSGGRSAGISDTSMERQSSVDEGVLQSIGSSMERSGAMGGGIL